MTFLFSIRFGFWRKKKVFWPIVKNMLSVNRWLVSRLARTVNAVYSIKTYKNVIHHMCFVQCKRDCEKKNWTLLNFAEKILLKMNIKNSEITYISQRDKNANCMNVMQYLYLLTRLLLPLLPCQIQCYMYRR